MLRMESLRPVVDFVSCFRGEGLGTTNTTYLQHLISTFATYCNNIHTLEPESQ